MRKIPILIIALISFYNINAQTLQKPVIISALLDSIYGDRITPTYQLTVLKVFSGQYNLDTISAENHCIMRYNTKVGDTLVLEIWKKDNNYHFYEDINSFSPVGSFFKIDKWFLDYIQISSYEELVNMLSNYYNMINEPNDQKRLKNILDIIYKKEQAFFIKYAALMNLRIYSQNTCFPAPYVEKELINISNDTTLEIKIRKQAVHAIGFSKELEIKIDPISLDYLETYFMPLWKDDLQFCDSMIAKYESIILNYPVIKDTISLSNRENLFFSGKIKKVSNNTLTIKNLTIFEGKYSKEEITLRTDIDTTFNKKIIGENILISATIINNKYILELNTKNKGFCIPPLTPDGNNMFIIDESNLIKSNIKIKPNELVKVITGYYLILNSQIKIKERELIKIIVKGEYMFLRQRSLWEFSDLSLQYDSLCWDFNEKYNLLDTLSTQFGKYKAPPIALIATADLLLNKSFNQSYKSKYNTNIYEFDKSTNISQLLKYKSFLDSENDFAQKYAILRFQDIIIYYNTLKKILQERIEYYKD
jgi:hypothetical protein